MRHTGKEKHPGDLQLAKESVAVGFPWCCTHEVVGQCLITPGTALRPRQVLHGAVAPPTLAGDGKCLSLVFAGHLSDAFASLSCVILFLQLTCLYFIPA